MTLVILPLTCSSISALSWCVSLCLVTAHTVVSIRCDGNVAAFDSHAANQVMTSAWRRALPGSANVLSSFCWVCQVQSLEESTRACRPSRLSPSERVVAHIHVIFQCQSNLYRGDRCTCRTQWQHNRIEQPAGTQSELTAASSMSPGANRLQKQLQASASCILTDTTCITPQFLWSQVRPR